MFNVGHDYPNNERRVAGNSRVLNDRDIELLGFANS
jgi:hypothetical protein